MIGVGCGLIGIAFAANQSWLDHHVLPSFWMPRDEIVATERFARVALAVIGAIIALAVRKPLARFFANEPLYLITIPLAIVLAAAVAELVLRTRMRLDVQHAAAAAGWFATAPTRHDRYLGEDIAYALDANGYRVASSSSRTDFDAPTIVFAGESIMAGLKLQWADTIPAQTSSLLGVQSANIAVPGFTTDDAYLRLRAELPKFRRPVAVVSLFAPSLFDRNLDDAEHWYLRAVLRRLIPYRSEVTIDRGVQVTRAALRATVELARSRGAVPLIVVPEFGSEEEPGERALRRRILDEEHLPYVRVMVNPDDRVENDGHPDADGARTIAVAIADALQRAK